MARGTGGSPDNAKYMTLDQITKANVHQLQVAWTYPTQDNITYAFNPVVVDNVMYVFARNYSLVALDATTGKELWIHEGLQGIDNLSPRGTVYWESKDRSDRRLFIQHNNFLQAIDARTGQSILTFGQDGVVNLRDGLGRDPQTVVQVQSRVIGKVFENLLIMGSSSGENYMSPPGDLRAYDVVTGKLVWQFHTVPQPGEFGYDTWPKDAWRYAGGANTWGEISIDAERGIAYFPTGSPTYDFYGADRPGINLFGTALLALDARTGKRLWHFQMVHHDLWDWDNSAAPVLTTVRRNGRMVDVVAQAGKTGFLYVFDRVTGEPIWPMEERPVPPSDVPGEKAWPTQPFPTAPPPFARQTFSAGDLNPFILTPAQREEWKLRLAKSQGGGGGAGMFTPLSADRETIIMPGTQGGANVGTTAANPSDGSVYVLGINMPFIQRLQLERGRGGAPPVAAAVVQQGAAIYEERCESCHGADRQGTGGSPSLIGVTGRLGPDALRSVIVDGRGPMPPIDLNANELQSLVAFLTGPLAGGRGRGSGPVRAPTVLGGPVVASGGAPAGRAQPNGQAPTTGNNIGPDWAYPPGTTGAELRYFSTGGGPAALAGPPYATLTKYNLNTGTIAWQVASGGEDARAVTEGGRETGFIQHRTGMIITSTGLMFQVGGDAKLRVHDTDTGKVLWTTPLPTGGGRALPAMYEVNGRQFLVVNASAVHTAAMGPTSGGARGYVAFALPAANAR